MPTEKQSTRPNKLQQWMSKASSAEKAAFAQRAGTTVATLRQIAGAYRTGGVLRVDADTALAIEKASREMHEANPKLPVILRIHLSPACASCDIAKSHFRRG